MEEVETKQGWRLCTEERGGIIIWSSPSGSQSRTGTGAVTAWEPLVMVVLVCDTVRDNTVLICRASEMSGGYDPKQ